MGFDRPSLLARKSSKSPRCQGIIPPIFFQQSSFLRDKREYLHLQGTTQSSAGMVGVVLAEAEPQTLQGVAVPLEGRRRKSCGVWRVLTMRPSRCRLRTTGTVEAAGVTSSGVADGYDRIGAEGSTVTGARVAVRRRVDLRRRRTVVRHIGEPCR